MLVIHPRSAPRKSPTDWELGEARLLQRCWQWAVGWERAARVERQRRTHSRPRDTSTRAVTLRAARGDARPHAPGTAYGRVQRVVRPVTGGQAARGGAGGQVRRVVQRQRVRYLCAHAAAQHVHHHVCYRPARPSRSTHPRGGPWPCLLTPGTATDARRYARLERRCLAVDAGQWGSRRDTAHRLPSQTMWSGIGAEAARSVSIRRTPTVSVSRRR